ncbi:MAG TPA: hypothetical protein P5534_04375 [Candidatus Paceibacterota bacterium]|nr:hypothetical protein [Candidatus Paceibacterota bacterium]HRZ54206.1 hypothetical protein [Candidatus Paceibacterota bacterium]
MKPPTKTNHDKVDYYFSKNPSFYWMVRSRKSPLLRFVTILLICYGVVALACWRQDALFLPKPSIGFFQDPYFVAVIITMIIVLIMIRRLLLRVEDLIEKFPQMLKPDQIDELSEKGALSASSDRVRDIIALRDPSARKWHRLYMCFWLLIVVILHVAMPFLDQMGHSSWGVSPRQYPLSYSFAVTSSFLLWLVVAGNLTWYVFATGFAVFPLIKQYASREKLWIVPNAPDGQGGLSAIGDVAFGMSTALGSGMIMLVVWIFLVGAEKAPTILAGGLYSLVLSATFFGPLRSVHGAMMRAKNGELDRISSLFRREYEKLPPSNSEDNSTKATNPALDSELSDRLALMAKLDAVYTTVNAMPVWPFDLGTIRKFLLLISIPVVSALLQKFWPSAVGTVVAEIVKGFRP